MYEEILKQLEEWLKLDYNRPENLNKIIIELDLIIKIKTIQAMDVSAELIRESRKILGK